MIVNCGCKEKYKEPSGACAAGKYCLNTPDTEGDAYRRGYVQGRFDADMDRLNEEKPTPDTEWESVEEIVNNFTRPDEFVDREAYMDEHDYARFKEELRAALIARDTYWKERVITWVKENSKELSDPYPFDSKYTYADFVSASELEELLVNEDNLK